MNDTRYIAYLSGDLFVKDTEFNCWYFNINKLGTYERFLLTVQNAEVHRFGGKSQYIDEATLKSVNVEVFELMQTFKSRLAMDYYDVRRKQ